ncbi:MAG TPA: hypothetical protein VL996_10460 [Methylocella sp.]|nr:hypothetical protein [Methylocella sp.]
MYLVAITWIFIATRRGFAGEPPLPGRAGPLSGRAGGPSTVCWYDWCAGLRWAALGPGWRALDRVLV